MASRPPAAQPGQPANNQHTHRMYRRASRAAQSCTRVQDERHPTDHGAAGAPHLCNSPTPTQTDGVADGVPTAGNPTPSWYDCSTYPLHGVASSSILHPCVKRTPTQMDGIAEASRQSVTQLDLVHEQPALHSRQVVVERTDIVRKRACPSPSEVLAGIVRRRAYPSSSGEHLDNVRRKGVCQSFLLRGTQRQRRSTSPKM